MSKILKKLKGNDHILRSAYYFVGRKVQKLLRLNKRPLKLLNFEVNLCDHCNLNCKGCSHFCPVAEEHFYDVAIFERDCKRLSELTSRKINYIELMGGEPLLHPQAIEFMRIARKYFDGGIKITTNGILLSEQKPEFWEACRDNQVEVVVSVYPIKIDIEKIEKTAMQYGVKMTGRKEKENETKAWYRLGMDLDGKQNVSKNFYSCHAANTYIQLQDGKLATCHAPFVSANFNRFFGDKLHVSLYDYIDIYKAKDIHEILKFLSNPIPYCRYCKPTLFEPTNWEVSKKQLSEWV